ncbi:MAG: hypothetical protein Tp1111SUR522732_35 [Prokaryotic dsDNA virus sp.]|jgi:hypothetical protein|nr:MAG: hypothetical protein Tp1111SUR522732_35 [Prokaryotic dsDNA virus sp.]|tara:strand:+ start:932 stop:1327 length:396 start_codon:yes stop_codon:yes gene_type:complete
MQAGRSGVEVSTHPADDEFANDCLKLWGAMDRLYGPRAYPKSSAFVLRARGQEIDTDIVLVEIVGRVVVDLHHQDRDIVGLYYKPGENGKCCSVRAISAKLGFHHTVINRAIDRCIGRVAQAIKMLSHEVY